MEFLNSILDNSQLPILTAFILGLLTALSPCPLATNITAIGYISKDLDNKHISFIRGLVYTLGRVISYSVLGIIIIYLIKAGESVFNIQSILNKYSEVLLGPFLLIMGILMLVGHKLRIPFFNLNFNVTGRKKDLWGALFIGIIFALAFCPTSGVFYFGMLMPLSASVNEGYFLPVIFAIATGLPVIIVSWILSYSISNISKFYKKMNIIEKYLKIVVSILFIIVGIYYLYISII